MNRLINASALTVALLFSMSTLMFSSDILSASLASAATVKMINDKESAVAPRHPQTVPIIVGWIPNSEWSQEKTHD